MRGPADKEKAPRSLPFPGAVITGFQNSIVRNRGCWFFCQSLCRAFMRRFQRLPALLVGSFAQQHHAVVAPDRFSDPNHIRRRYPSWYRVRCRDRWKHCRLLRQISHLRGYSLVWVSRIDALLIGTVACPFLLFCRIFRRSGRRSLETHIPHR